MMKKTAQVEGIGLVIIVFLLALGMFFIVSISTKENIDAQKISPQNIKLAQNTIDAIKNINIECQTGPLLRKIPISEFIQDVGYTNRIECDFNPSSVVLDQTVGTILNKTLVNWSKPFVFRIEKDGEDLITPIINLNCTEDSPGDQGFQAFPLPKNSGTVAMILYVCV